MIVYFRLYLLVHDGTGDHVRSWHKHLDSPPPPREAHSSVQVYVMEVPGLYFPDGSDLTA